MKITRLNAAVEEKPEQFRGIPYRLSANAIYKTMLSLGIKLPTDDLQKIAASGLKLDVKQIDEGSSTSRDGAGARMWIIGSTCVRAPFFYNRVTNDN
jgi:hypothetical protein